MTSEPFRFNGIASIQRDFTSGRREHRLKDERLTTVGTPNLWVRHRRGKRHLGRSLSRALAASPLPFHVRARLRGGVSIVLVDCRRVRRLRGAPCQPRRVALGGIAGADRQAAGIQISRERRRTAATSGSTLTSRSPRCSSARGMSNTTTGGGHAMNQTPVPPLVARFAAMCCTDAATYRRDRPGRSAFVLEDGVVHHTYSTYARGLAGLWICTSGSTGLLWAATRRAPGGDRRHDDADPSDACAGAGSTDAEFALERSGRARPAAAACCGPPRARRESHAVLPKRRCPHPL